MNVGDMALKLSRTNKAVKHRLSSMDLSCMDGRATEKLKIGDTYGLFTILEHFIKTTKCGKFTYYRCECECGNIKEIPKHNLITGASNSCGCARRGLLSPGEGTINEKYAICRQGAKTRNLIFELSPEQHREIVIRDCFYCGESPLPYNRYLRKDGSVRKWITKQGRVSQKTIDRAWVSINTIDRIDSGLGYSIDNCVSSCWPCNEMKMDSSYDNFIAKARKIVEFQEKKKYG